MTTDLPWVVTNVDATGELRDRGFESEDEAVAWAAELRAYGWEPTIIGPG